MDSDYWFYFNYARELAKIPRKSCIGSQFNHQIAVWGLLIMYGYSDDVLLKAAIIHDLFEDGPRVGFTDFERIKEIGTDGADVFDLVHEVTINCSTTGAKEAKADFLLRIMIHGSERAKILKLADRLANIGDLAFPNLDPNFVNRYLDETTEFIVPYSSDINNDMAKELLILCKLNFLLLKRRSG